MVIKASPPGNKGTNYNPASEYSLLKAYAEAIKAGISNGKLDFGY